MRGPKPTEGAVWLTGNRALSRLMGRDYHRRRGPKPTEGAVWLTGLATEKAKRCKQRMAPLRARSRARTLSRMESRLCRRSVSRLAAARAVNTRGRKPMAINKVLVGESLVGDGNEVWLCSPRWHLPQAWVFLWLRRAEAPGSA